MNNYYDYYNNECNSDSYNNYYDTNIYEYETRDIISYPQKMMFQKEMNHDLYEPVEALKRGNLFKGLYKPYLNQEFELQPGSEKEKDLIHLMAYDLAAHDLHLYLDNHPDDTRAFTIFKRFIEECKKLKKEYESKYGPISVDDMMGNGYTWDSTPWPWEGR